MKIEPEMSWQSWRNARLYKPNRKLKVPNDRRDYWIDVVLWVAVVAVWAYFTVRLSDLAGWLER